MPQLSRRKLSFFLIFASLLIIVPMTLAQDGSDVAPPRIIETTPLAGEELGLDSTVSFIFDRPMNTDLGSTAVIVEPAQASLGTLAWEDNRTLVYTPTSNYERDTAYTFTINAADADGLVMAEPYKLTLNTIGYLEVADVIPADDTREIEADATITVIFNRPVVPLVSLEQLDELPNPLTIEPAVAGTGEWLNTSIFIFRPEAGLQGGVDYTVTVNSGLAAVDGAILEDDYSFSFTTAPPEIESIRISPKNNTVPLDPTFTVSFTQRMDTTTQDGIRLIDNLGNDVALEFEWSETTRSVTATPVDLLTLDSFYQFFVDSATVKSETGANIRETRSEEFVTVPYPEILSTNPSNGEANANPYGGFRIYFSAPIDPETVADKVTIEPAPWREFETYYYEYDNRFSLLFDTEPSTTYTITIAPGIMDPYGNTIDEQLVVRYTTDPYSPDLTLQTPGRVGVYNAYNPSTQLFATHRNVSQINLHLNSISLRQLARITGPNGYRFFDDYTPTPDQVMRDWTVPVSAPENVMRYELLTISEFGDSGVENINCVGAAEPRLIPGINAVVSDDDPSPLRVRAEPNLTGDIVTEYDPGTEISIRSGPICGDGYWWWQIYHTADDVLGWMAEGDLNSYYLDPVGEVPDIETMELPPLPPGAYYIHATTPETNARGWNPLRHIMIVATTNVTMKFSNKQAVAWVTDMESGAPEANMEVTFYSENFGEIATAFTDENGLAQVSIPKLDSLYTTIYAVVDIDGKFGFVATDLSRGLDPWQFNLSADYNPDNDTVYLYTDRPIYRPDQPVYFRGVLRAQDDVTYTLMDVNEVLVTVYDSERQVVYEELVGLTPYGTFNDSFDLDIDAALGYYRITIAVPDGEGYSEEASLGFNVAEYRAPEFQVTVTPTEDGVVQGEDLLVEVDSRYFFGAPVSNARLVWNVLGDNYYFRYDGPGRYNFIDFNYDEGPREYYGSSGEQIAEGESVTDDQGKFFIELPTDLGEKTQSQVYTIEAIVIDETDQAVAGRAEVIIHQGNVYVGLAPEKYVSQAGEETSFRVISVDWDSEVVAEQVVDYRIVRREWSSVQEKDPQGRTVWKWEVEEIEIEDGTVTTGEDGKADILFTPPEGGAYKIYGVTRDVDGNVVNSSAFMWVSGSNYVAWRQQNSNTIDLISDSDSYSVGDTAEILIASPFQGETWALVSVERGDILETEVVRMDTNSYVYNLPITDAHAPNIYVSVVLVKGLDENSPFTQYRYGLIQLGVDTERLNLNIDVAANLGENEFAGPGDEVELTVSTTDFDGNPVSAEVGVGVTDLSVLSIAPANSGTLMGHFYGQQGLSVRTASPLSVSADQVTQEIIDTIKGGGGGGNELGIFEVRQEFVDTPLWDPTIVTDENGTATVTVTLPDNLTTWRIDARGVTDGVDRQMLVGQTTTDFLSTKPLIIRPVTPRFMVVGDKLNLGTVINNNTSEDQVVDVLMEGTGFLVSDETPLSQQVTIPAKGRVRVDWQVEILDVPFVDVTFAAINADQTLQDASKPAVGQGDDRVLPVYRFTVKETVGTAGVLEAETASSYTEVIALPPHLIDDSRGDLQIEIDRSLAGPMLDGLDYLKNYPHQCIEQTVSRFLPNVMTIRALNTLGQSNPELEAELQTQVNFGLQRLYSQQKVDGGWGWFPTDPSNPLTTSYALIGLVEARDSGFPVEPKVISDARTFLRRWLIETSGDARVTDTSWVLNRRAFVLYAMTRAGEPNASFATVVYDKREILNLDAKAYLAMTMMLIDPNDSRIEVLMSDFTNAAVLSATGAHWDDRPDYYNWTTNTRTTALILMAMIKSGESTPLLANVVRWMMVARTADAWETTQETAWAVMALTDWMVATGELDADYEFNVRLNGDVLEFEDNTANAGNVKENEQLRVEIGNLLIDEANRLIISKTDGPGNLYYTAHMNSYLKVPEVEAQSRGIIVDRKYYLVDDETRTPIDSAEVGQQVRVEVTIVAPRNLHYVVVEDPIPAGAEAVDPNLLTTSQLGQRPSLDRADPLSRGWGWWWFSRTEFRDEKVVMYSTYLPRGTYTYTYTIRLGLAGEYNVIPTTGQEFYFPEVYGRGDGMLFTIEPASEE